MSHALKGMDRDVRRESIEGENIRSGRENRERTSGGKRERKQNGAIETTRRKKQEVMKERKRDVTRRKNTQQEHAGHTETS